MQTYTLAEMSKKIWPLVSRFISNVTGPHHQKICYLLALPIKKLHKSSFQWTRHNLLKCEIGRNLLGFGMWVRSPTIFKKSPLRTTFPSAQYRAPGSISLFTSRKTSTAPPCATAPGLAPCGSLISVGPEICKLLTLSIRDIVHVTHFVSVSRSVGQWMLWPEKGANGILTKASPIPPVPSWPGRRSRLWKGYDLTSWESSSHTFLEAPEMDESRSNSEKTPSSPGDDNHRAQSDSSEVNNRPTKVQ